MKEVVLILFGLLIIAGCNSDKVVVLSEIPFVDESHGLDRVVVPVEINSTTYHFLVDTGASVTTFDKKIAYQLGNDIKTVKDADNVKKIRTETKLYSGPKKFKIGKIKIVGDPGVPVFACLDLSLLWGKEPLDIDGIIGVDIFKESIVQFDFDHKIMRIMQYSKGKAPDLMAERNEWGDSVPMITDESCRPFIEINLTESVKELFLIDTGMPTNTMILNKDKIRSIRDKANEIVYFYEESNNQEALIFNNVRIGEAVLSEMLFAEPPQGYSVPSLITTNLFGKLKMLTFDFAQKKIYLVPK